MWVLGRRGVVGPKGSEHKKWPALTCTLCYNTKLLFIYLSSYLFIIHCIYLFKWQELNPELQARFTNGLLLNSIKPQVHNLRTSLPFPSTPPSLVLAVSMELMASDMVGSCLVHGWGWGVSAARLPSVRRHTPWPQGFHQYCYAFCTD